VAVIVGRSLGEAKGAWGRHSVARRAPFAGISRIRFQGYDLNQATSASLMPLAASEVYRDRSGEGSPPGLPAWV